MLILNPNTHYPTWAGGRALTGPKDVDPQAYNILPDLRPISQLSDPLPPLPRQQQQQQQQQQQPQQQQMAFKMLRVNQQQPVSGFQNMVPPAFSFGMPTLPVPAFSLMSSAPAASQPPALEDAVVKKEVVIVPSSSDDEVSSKRSSSPSPTKADL